MVEDRLHYAEAVENLERTAGQAVCMAVYSSPGLIIQDSCAYIVSAGPSGSYETRRTRPDDDDVGVCHLFLGHL